MTLTPGSPCPTCGQVVPAACVDPAPEPNPEPPPATDPLDSLPPMPSHLSAAYPHVVTWNIHGINHHPYPSEWAWQYRKPVVEQVLLSLVERGVDIICLQEVNSDAQRDDIKAMLGPEWHHTRDSGNDYNFYRHAKYARITHRDLNLYSPSGQSRDANEDQFEDKQTGVRFYVCSTHLSSGDATSRAAEAERLINYTSSRSRIIFPGDYNNTAKVGSTPRQQFADSGREQLQGNPAVTNGDWNTYHNFGPPARNGEWLDEIFYTAGFVELAEAEVHIEAGNASDHYPIRALFRITQKV